MAWIVKCEYRIYWFCLPVVFVCCPRTRSPQKCLRPRCARIFFSLSRSSRSLESTPFDKICEFLPSTISFCLFKNQVGILNCVGFWIIVTSRSSSSEFSSPALSHHKTWISTPPMHHVPFVKIYVCFLAHYVGVTATHTLYFCHSIHDLPFTVDICVQKTQNVLNMTYVRGTPRQPTTVPPEIADAPLGQQETSFILRGFSWVRIMNQYACSVIQCQSSQSIP